MVAATAAVGQGAGKRCPEFHPSKEPGKWTWMDGECKVRTRADLDKILANHALWLRKYLEHVHESFGTIMSDHLRADLSGAQLRFADLTDAELSFADLTGVRLENADLSRADLSQADLIKADFDGADLTGA